MKFRKLWKRKFSGMFRQHQACMKFEAEVIRKEPYERTGSFIDIVRRINHETHTLRLHVVNC